MNIIELSDKSFKEAFAEGFSVYAMLKDDKIIGVSTVDNSLEYNKIKVYVNEEERSNGYGKMLFKRAVDGYIDKYGINKLDFKVEANENNSRFLNILLKAGAIRYNYKEGVEYYALPLGNWEEKKNMFFKEEVR